MTMGAGRRLAMAAAIAGVIGVAGSGAALRVEAQDMKPVPKNSVRINVPGCVSGYMFTAARRTEDTPGPAIPEGTHMRMNGKKDLMREIKGHEGSRLEITGLIRKGQELQPGVGIGGGARISGGPAPGGGGVSVGMGRVGGSPMMIDVEGYRVVPGDCPR